MDTTKEIWDALAAIPIGTIVGWISILAIIIGAFCAGAIKLYTAFEEFKRVNDEKEHLKETVAAHENKIADVDAKLTIILAEIEAQRVTTMKRLRRELVQDGERYLRAGKMTIREWKSLHEMYDEYTINYHQNSYVKTLVEKVDSSVEIIGSLDEHGNDIE